MSFNAPISDVPNGCPIDPRTLGLGLLTGIEEEFLGCAPLVCSESAWSALWRLGVRGSAITGRDAFDGIAIEPVVFHSECRFEFSKYMPGNQANSAAIIPARDEYGELVDLAAWNHETDTLALRRGAAPALGLENATRPPTNRPLLVHETVLGWLRAGREGLVIIDPSRAARALDGTTLAVRSVAFGRRLRETMTIEPQIVVARQRRRAA
jgi:hypothetical protein